MAKRKVRVPPETADTPLHVRMIAAIRLKKNWTQDELGAALSMSARTVRQWEKQTTEPKTIVMAALRDLLEDT